MQQHILQQEIIDWKTVLRWQVVVKMSTCCGSDYCSRKLALKIQYQHSRHGVIYILNQIATFKKLAELRLKYILGCRLELKKITCCRYIYGPCCFAKYLKHVTPAQAVPIITFYFWECLKRHTFWYLYQNKVEHFLQTFLYQLKLRLNRIVCFGPRNFNFNKHYWK